MQVSALLGQQKSKFFTPMDFYKYSQSGLTKRSVVSLAKNTDITISYLMSLAGVNVRTLQRKSEDEALSSDISEKLLQVAQVISKGTEVFESLSSFKDWLETPNISLDSAVPAKIVSSRYGAEMVLDCLGRIQYGVFS